MIDLPFDPSDIWHVPTVLYPTQEELNDEIPLIIQKGMAAQMFADGEISPTDYVDWLHSIGEDPSDILDMGEYRLNALRASLGIK